ncbi:phosducin-like protein 3 homolog [Prunus dulcis]|uniref:Phosducin-like protein 3 homolog n=1 Tax=Prunus dulcis TaxID=3755 RepID=A0A4Y1RFI7_PRUDU|nr:phosducin-like protein 3 homolog [Prunus dulcis]
MSHISSSSSSLISFSTSSASSSSSSFLLLPSPDPVKAKRSLRVKTETKAHTEPFVRASVIEGIGSASVLENPPRGLRFGVRVEEFSFPGKMDPASVKSTLQNLAFGNVMAAAARNYQKELLANEKAPATSSVNQEVDLDELMDDPELEKLHADRIAALKQLDRIFRILFGIMDKHLKTLASKHVDTEFIKLDAEFSINFNMVLSSYNWYRV